MGWPELASSAALAALLLRKRAVTPGALALGIADLAVLSLLGGSPWTTTFLAVVALTLIVPRLARSRSTPTTAKGPRDWRDVVPVTVACAGGLALHAAGDSASRGAAPFHAALAYVVADVFASEIRPPGLTTRARLVTRGFAVVPHGTPGAISASGLLFSVVGASAVAALHYLSWRDVAPLPVIVVAGAVACLLESLFAELRAARSWRLGNEAINALFVGIALVLSSAYTVLSS